ncbi:hypothetical protein FE257_010341 [Aspergillus nanangensis]|uniref:Major facilitator superfamily (MFS) profile domain-containing protein n=1 Tax=Aspergillus nanangensis TaxID=2582783 RepID=A0AAD4CIU2_ASPNN|nr:hypothetical protein FE257_010341 [Aspergillus nanangensis]
MPPPSPTQWGHKWRSSPFFIVASMAMALYTDPECFLYAFIVPILPYIVETRLGVDASLTQRISFSLLGLSALTSLICSPMIAAYADGLSSKRGILLVSLGVAIVGSGVLALATSGALSRFIQAVSAAFIWVVGYATIAENVPAAHIGKVYGIISLVVGVGTSGGPILAGMLFEWGGYWVAWASSFVMLAVDMGLRGLMLERNKRDNGPLPQDSGYELETEPFLSDDTTTVDEIKGLQFYRYVLCHRRLVGGIIAYMTSSLLVASFDATLPLHVRDVFGWGTSASGVMFLALQGPGVISSPLVGWLKDRVGSRWPTAIAFLGSAPFVWLLGVPGDDRFPWANVGSRGETIYTIGAVVIGSVFSLSNGVGPIEATTTVDEIEANHPGIFGRNGGYSRALAITNMSWTLGSLVGPVLSGQLVESVGYYEMCGVMAFLLLLTGASAVICLDSKIQLQGTRPRSKEERR